MSFWPFKARVKTGISLSAEQVVSDAMEKLVLLLSKDKKTLKGIFLEIENAKDAKGLLAGFVKINNYFRYLLRMEPSFDTYGSIRSALEKHETSIKFLSKMKSASSLEDALYRYKTEVVQTLSRDLRKCEEEDIRRSTLDRELVQRFFPEHTTTKEQEEDFDGVALPVRKSSKRKISMIDYSPGTPLSRKTRYTGNNDSRRERVEMSYQDRKYKRGKNCRYKHIDIDI